ncbi:UvrY/SirA/GacA family response regulator transcription factor [Psychrobium sp. 1_MG-2023]|uniref:UvrY/SirA/GacA family response regulator transcription factor n=1 Tax=Psychrobium sp. 1_MG-2023 TaxID=3062624 RepID=UPI000C326737|nr:UvrY/SirA/GacA family response regulator transcription factor [Psychrobium sp. 1_MG-2023]MDP2562572.1 UvrY/SirA/GacA family response regulator transcription factor [Psychrobium sp. 1_MG-2023]PKF59661.1 two-component system response regulator UvrY [Alteromonadales bacterium alter-6D02]
MINVFLVDDHELVRTGIKRLLEDVRGMKVVGEADSGETAVQWCRNNDTDIVLMDMNMPGIGGIEATRRILRLNPDIKIIVISIHSEEPYPTKVMQAGAAGYLTKGAAPNEMINAIRQVKTGQRYLSPEIAQQMALSQFRPAEDNPFQALSDRELQIMMMITTGQKVNDISEQLSLSPKTVNSYRYRLFSKLEVSGDVELTHLAIRHGFLDTEKL